MDVETAKGKSKTKNKHFKRIEGQVFGARLI
jgi:hypothetical protein